ncbi:MAG: hypothetical protein HYX32_14765 [Actinobacteria bacterium]|nr:hypothetical protein [Actinomycetota bacterium]
MHTSPPRGRRALTILAATTLAAAAACSVPPGPTPTTTVPPPGTTGPRPLPPTFVPLEIAQFARPAAEACADNRTVVDVANGQSIAAAMNAAAPGTTIRVAAGTYVESAGEPTALTWSTPNLCVVASGGPVVLRSALNQKYGIEITGDDTVIEGITLRGFEAAISLNAAGGATQRRVTIQDVGIEDMTGPQRDGIVAYGDNRGEPNDPPTVDGLLLLGVQVSGTDVGVSCNAGPCAHWWIERTTITGRTQSGGSGADTFAIEEGRQIAVVDSTMKNAGADGIDTKADDVVVFGARVLDAQRNGVKLWRGGDVIDTVVDGTGADASLVGDRAGRYRYLHTLIAHHGQPGDTQYVGWWGYDSPNEPGMRIEIVNSIFWQNATGGLFAPATADVSIRNSMFADGGAKLLDLSDGTLYDTSPAGLTALERSGRGARNLLAEPQFVSPARPDYGTLAGSRARDAGEPTAGLLRDLGGRPRVAGAGPDIGPTESA